MTKPCAFCLAEFRVKPSHYALKTYCSRACMAEGYRRRLAGERNPNYRAAGNRTCLACYEAFRSYDKNRLYCSIRCRPATRNLGALVKDKIHDAVVLALADHGVHAIDTSSVGNGMPDLIVPHHDDGRPILLEVKSPSGRLSARQRQWQAEWKGAPPVIVKTVEQALAAVGLLKAA